MNTQGHKNTARRVRVAAALCASVIGCIALAPANAGDIRIAMLSDIALGSVAPTTGQLAAATDFCVSLSEPGRYSVVARGNGPGDDFVLSNGVSSLPLAIFYSDRPRRRGVRLKPGTPLLGLRGKKRKNRRDCHSLNARIEVVIGALDLEASPSGSYRGVVTLTVSPQ